jgi:hypothetical protein
MSLFCRGLGCCMRFCHGLLGVWPLWLWRVFSLEFFFAFLVDLFKKGSVIHVNMTIGKSMFCYIRFAAAPKDIYTYRVT